MDTFARGNVAQVAVAAEAAEAPKRQNYINLKDRFIFAPIAFERSGVGRPSTLATERELFSTLVDASGDARFFVSDTLPQRS